MITYNQQKYWIWPDCVPTTCMQIIKNKYWIDCKYTFLNKIVLKALQFKVLFKSWGAKFEVYYNWFIKEINKQTGLNFIVNKKEIDWLGFEKSLNNNSFYWLRLKNWNSSYLNAIKKWVLTIKDIIDISEEWWWFKHNNCFWKDWLDEVFTWDRIDLPLEVLIFWVGLGVFWNIWRDIMPDIRDDFTKDVCDLLIRWRDNPNYDPYIKWKSNKYDINVMNKAWNLLQKYEFWPKYF